MNKPEPNMMSDTELCSQAEKLPQALHPIFAEILHRFKVQPAANACPYCLGMQPAVRNCSHCGGSGVDLD